VAAVKRKDTRKLLGTAKGDGKMQDAEIMAIEKRNMYRIKEK